MAPFTQIGVERFALLLGLSLFFGFAFEGFYADTLPRRPGGVRTFPLLALAGGSLYLLEPSNGAAFIAGLVVLGVWIYTYVRRQTKNADATEGLLIVPVCNLLAYLLGPIALTQPLWLAIAVAVVAVLLLSGRHTLHDWAKQFPAREIITTGQFLLLVGVILPLLAGRPPIPHTTITPFGIWLAVVAVSSISYASYLLQRYVFPRGGTLLASILGGLYSSTATTIVLARRSREEGMTRELESGIVAATAMMYLRILIVCSLFDRELGRTLLFPLLGLTALSILLAARRFRGGQQTVAAISPRNPLQLGTALVFALLFVAISLLTTLVENRFGRAGIFGLAGIVGVTDIDPFVLNLAQGGATMAGLSTAAAAIVIASSSNNLLKAVYTIAFSRRRESWIPAALLVALAVFGVAIALFAIR